MIVVADFLGAGHVESLRGFENQLFQNIDTRSATVDGGLLER